MSKLSLFSVIFTAAMLCSILSMGAGASTKLTAGDGRLERVFAPKYAKEYIDGIDAVVSGKQKITDFFRGAGK